MEIFVNDDLQSLNATHKAYADETNHNVGRYRGVALITLEASKAKNASQIIKTILLESEIRELKWVKLRTARMRFAVIKIIDFVIEWLFKGFMRIDTLIWDIEDARHKITNRSDIRNLRRMYYFLFQNVLGSRWSEDCIWDLHPDTTTFQASSHLCYLGLEENFNKNARNVNVRSISEIKSTQEPLIQVADFFAGIAAYSRDSYSKYEQWQECKLTSGNKIMEYVLSNADKERCYVLNYLDNSCKKRKLGVRLKSTHGLRSLNPFKPLNFWLYEPQEQYDKAPKWN